MWELQISDREKILPVIFKLADEVEPRHGIKLRKMSRRSLRKDMDRFADVYNSAWSENWGFSPYSKKDLDAYTQELHLVFDQHWFMVAETAEGETAAVAITVPDVNQVLAKMNGRLLPLRLVALPAQGADDRPRARRLPRRQAAVPAHRRGGEDVRRALRHGLVDAPDSGARWGGSSRPTRT